MPISKSKRKKAGTAKRNSKRSANPLTVVSIARERKSVLVKLDEIHKSDWMVETDPIYLGLYEKYTKGNISGFLTRVSIEDVLEGFYVASRDFEYVCDQPPEVVVAAEEHQIRLGARPPLFLYRNVKAELPGKFLCPDEVVLVKAYRRLKLKTVPAIVLSVGNEPLRYSSFETRATKAHLKYGPKIIKIIPPAPRTSLLISSLMTLPKVLWKSLKRSTNSSLTSWRRFAHSIATMIASSTIITCFFLR